MKVTVILFGVPRNNPQRISKGTGSLGYKKTSGDHPDFRISQNTEKSPVNFGRLALTQTPVKKNPSALGGVKNSQSNNNNNDNNNKTPMGL